jgi:predicted nucleic acid-binding Zn ribbon protein
MSPYRRAPRSLAHAIDTIRNDLAPQTLLADVQGVWLDAVGPAVAAEALPTAERGGVLTVSCSASVWAQELDLMSQPILERVNGLLSQGRIARLRCVAGGRPQGPV